MSYRTFKKVLGETSLERKFRFLFGIGLLLLIAGSFYFYARLNLKLVRDQYARQAQLLITSNLQTVHWRFFTEQDAEGNVDSETTVKRGESSTPKGETHTPSTETTGESPSTASTKSAPQKVRLREIVWDSREVAKFKEIFKPEDLREQQWDFFATDPGKSEAAGRPESIDEYEALNTLKRELAAGEVPSLLKSPPFVVQENHAEDAYLYYQAVLAEKNCLTCHQAIDPTVTEGRMLGMAKIKFDLHKTTQDVTLNNAILFAMAIATAFLAMLGSFLIIRYVIVKPVLHLKDVSDAVAQGDLDQRADIRTGDEFEELSHAFNRMLRHLVNVQDELRQVNTNLDAKVDELAGANLSLHEMNSLKSDFLSTMSHELRTPLNSILGFSDLLNEAEGLEERERKYVRNIQNSGKSLLALINDILDLAKMEAGKMELHVVEFPVADLVERLANGILPLADRKHIDLKWEVDPQVPLLHQDAGKLQQILYNLLSNAVKFTPEGGRIRMQALLKGRTLVEFVVADTGIGIPLQDQSRIFEKFRQGRALPGQNDPLTREYEGTGLGLSIVKELSRLLDGEVFLESEFGKGSTFTVTVPIRLNRLPNDGDDDTLRHATFQVHPQPQSPNGSNGG
ncbi:MAG: HAMP domain-containing sensor histidine kinase [Planctomycetaceae bacterium]